MYDLFSQTKFETRYVRAVSSYFLRPLSKFEFRFQEHLTHL